MKVLNLLAAGGVGGIETLCNNIDKSNQIESYWCFLFGGGRNANEIKKRNPKKTYILSYKKNKPMKIIKKVIEICKKNEIDIIVLHDDGIYCNLIYCILKKTIKKAKFVKFLHYCYEDKFSKYKNIKKFIYYYIFNKSIKSSDLVICVSKAVKKSFEQKFNLKKKKVIIIYNGISKDFINDTLTERNKKIKNVIYIGRIISEKGIDILIKSLKKVIKKCSDIRLTIVGNR